MAENTSDAAVDGVGEGDNLDPDGKTGATATDQVEGQAGSKEGEGQPSESSTENENQGSAQERIDEITGKYRSTERDRDYWKQRALDAEGQIPQPQPEVKLEKGLADFNGDEAAFAAYVAEETGKAYDETFQEQQQQSQRVATTREFLDHENDFAKDVPDYDQVTRADSLRISPDMKEFIMAAGPEGPALLYYLAKNPDTAADISVLPPMQAAARLAGLQATDLAKPAQSTTQTPAPGKRLRGQQRATEIDTGSPDSDKLSTDDWMKRERAKAIKRNDPGDV